jgi:hypothetical protein
VFERWPCLLAEELRRRLAYLVDEEAHYQALDLLVCTNSIGRLTLSLDRDPSARIVDIIRGSGLADRYVFTDAEIVTANIADVDVPLKAAFLARVAALDAAAAARLRKTG